MTVHQSMMSLENNYVSREYCYNEIRKCVSVMSFLENNFDFYVCFHQECFVKQLRENVR